MKSQAIVSILCLCLGSCLDFGEDLELSGGQVDELDRKMDKEFVSEVTFLDVNRRTGIDSFPSERREPSVWAICVQRGRQPDLGSGIDDALALKATMVVTERPEPTSSPTTKDSQGFHSRKKRNIHKRRHEQVLSSR